MMTIRIRKAKISDLSAVLDIYTRTVDGGRSLTRFQAVRVLRKMSRYPDYNLYVAYSGSRIVGAFELLIMDNLGHLGSPSAVVEDVAVHPEWQGRGIGKTMMRFAIDRCQKAKCYKLTLSSNLKRKTAHRFYESLGFGKHGFSFLIDLKGHGRGRLALRSEGALSERLESRGRERKERGFQSRASPEGRMTAVPNQR